MKFLGLVDIGAIKITRLPTHWGLQTHDFHLTTLFPRSQNIKQAIAADLEDAVKNVKERKDQLQSLNLKEAWVRWFGSGCGSSKCWS